MMTLYSFFLCASVWWSCENERKRDREEKGGRLIKTETKISNFCAAATDMRPSHFLSRHRLGRRKDVFWLNASDRDWNPGRI
jgi:hypothetical protein